MIKIIKEGDRVPPYYLLKCELCHSVLSFTNHDMDAYRVWNDRDAAIYHYERSLKCPICGHKNSLPCFSHEWSALEEGL